MGTDQIDAAVDAAEAKTEKAIDALAQVTLTFLADGGVHMSVGGDFRPATAWAFAEFLRNVGDDLFREAAAKRKAAMEAASPRIVVPMAGMRRVDR